MDAWDPNSGLHAYFVGTLPTEPSLQAHGDNFECKSQDLKRGDPMSLGSLLSRENDSLVPSPKVVGFHGE